MALGVIDPVSQDFPIGTGPGGIIGKTKIDQIDSLAGRSGNIMVSWCRLQIEQATVAPVRRGSGTTGHDVGVDIDGVDRIGDGDARLRGEDFLNMSAVAFRAIGNEYFVRGDVASERGVGAVGDGFSKEWVALLGAVSMKSLMGPQVVDGGVKSRTTGIWKRFGDVPNSHTDDSLVGVGSGVGLDPFGNFTE